MFPSALSAALPLIVERKEMLTADEIQLLNTVVLRTALQEILQPAISTRLGNEKLSQKA